MKNSGDFGSFRSNKRQFDRSKNSQKSMAKGGNITIDQREALRSSGGRETPGPPENVTAVTSPHFEDGEWRQRGGGKNWWKNG